MATILLTRPDPDNAALAQALESLGAEALVCPLLVEAPVAAGLDDLERFAGIIVTSKRALESVAPGRVTPAIARLPVYAVGETTARAAEALGFSSIHTAGGTGDDLARLIVAAAPKTPLLYLAARDRSPDLEAGLAAAGIAHTVRMVYAMDAVETLTPGARDALAEGAVDGVALYSRRTAAAFAALTQGAAFDRTRRALVCLCLSRACAEPLVAAGFAQVRIADRPEGAVMDRLVKDFAASFSRRDKQRLGLE